MVYIKCIPWNCQLGIPHCYMIAFVSKVGTHFADNCLIFNWPFNICLWLPRLLHLQSPNSKPELVDFFNSLEFFREKNAWWTHNIHFFPFPPKFKWLPYLNGCQKKTNHLDCSKFDSSQFTGGCWRKQRCFWNSEAGNSKTMDFLTHLRIFMINEWNCYKRRWNRNEIIEIQKYFENSPCKHEKRTF